MPDSNSFVDDKQNLSKLTFDLNLDENVTESISRIGRLSTNRHRPLKLQLRNERCASLYLEAAKQLRYMKVDWPKIGIYPDRSPDEVKSHQTMMKELRHRRSIGEQVQLVGDKIIPINMNNITSYQQSITPLCASQSCSPLRVAMPAENSNISSLVNGNSLLERNFADALKNQKNK